MLNGHTCHGGFIFALADSAFAFACNSRNLNTVASGAASTTWRRPARRRADRRAQERTLAGNGVYDITVSNQDGKAIALFRASPIASGRGHAGLPAAQQGHA
jgi:acyl-CoA thioesterase